MQTVNLTLMWWLAHGTTAPEAVVVYEALSPGKKALCRFALGPEVWTPRAEFDASGEWLGTVGYAVPDAPRLSLNGELPPPPSEIVMPVYAGFAPPARGDEDELVVGLTWDDKSEVKSEESGESEGSTKRRGPPATVCPPEVEALLGTDKDTLIAAQTGFSLHLISKWRTERDIPRYIKGGDAPKPEAPVRAAPVEPVEPDESALANIIAHRFPEGASDEDMAQEAGVSVAKVVEVRIALGLRRPRGRKPGVPQGPRKSKTDAAEATAVEQKAENEPDDERVSVAPASEGVVDADLDALLA